MSTHSLLSEMMRRKSSNSKSNDSLLKQTQTNLGSLYASDLRSYKKACERDPDLKSFDTFMHQRTDGVITSLAQGPEGQSLSFDSLVKFISSLLDMNQEAVRFIIKNREDVQKNEDFKSLVKLYFERSVETLDFYNAVENCVKRAKEIQGIMQLAVSEFDKEVKMEPQEGAIEKKHKKTMEQLNKFKAAGNPFAEDFFAGLESAYYQQVLLLEELSKQKKKLDKKMKNIESWRVVSNVVFVTTLVSVVILSVIAAAVGAPPVAVAVVGALPPLIELVKKCCSCLLKKYKNSVDGGQNDIVSEMAKHTFDVKTHASIMKENKNAIRLFVETLNIETESMRRMVDFAIEEGDEAVGFALAEIRKRLHGFVEKIEGLGQLAANHYHNVISARTAVLGNIIGDSSISSTQADLTGGSPQLQGLKCCKF